MQREVLGISVADAGEQGMFSRWTAANSGSISDEDSDGGWMDNMKEVGGNVLENVGDLSDEVQEEITRRVKEATDNIERIAEEKVNAVKSQLHEARKKVKGLERALEDAKSAFQDQAQALVDAAEEKFQEARAAAQEQFEKAQAAANRMKEYAASAMESMQSKLSAAKDYAAGLKDSLMGKLAGLYDAIKDKVGGAWETITGAVSAAAETLMELFREGIGGFVGRLMDFIGRVIVVRIQSAASVPAAIAGQIEGVIDGLWHMVTDEVVTVAVKGEECEAPPAEEEEESGGAWGAFSQLTEAAGFTHKDGPATVNDDKAKELGQAAFGENMNVKESLSALVSGITDNIPFMDTFSDIMGGDDDAEADLPEYPGEIDEEVEGPPEEEEEAPEE